MSVPDASRSTVFPVLPLRDIVVFPHMIVPLFVGREKSINALEDVMREDGKVQALDISALSSVTSSSSAPSRPSPSILASYPESLVVAGRCSKRL